MPRVTISKDCRTAADVILGIRTRVPLGHPRCPECGWPLDVDDEAELFDPLTGSRRAARLAWCYACDFTHEF